MKGRGAAATGGRVVPGVVVVAGMVVTVVVVTALGAATFAGAQVWEELGPSAVADFVFTGRIAGVVASPSDPGRYFAAGASGGIWRSDDAGASWRPLGDRLPTTACGAIALDPRDEDVVYVGSGEANFAYHSLYGAGIYRSSDGGESWQVLAESRFAGRTISRLAVGEDGVVWAAVGRAGGTSDGFEGARGHPDRRGPLGLFRSTNDGKTWRRVAGLPPIHAADVDLDPRDPRRVWATMTDVFGHPANGVYRSTDGGNTWRNTTSAFAGEGLGRIAVALAPTDPRRVYALVAQPAGRGSQGGFFPPGAGTWGLLVSGDDGGSWRRVETGNFMGSQGDYDIAVAVAPDDPDTVYLGGVQMLASRDGGESFENVTPPHVDLHDFAFDAAGRLLAAGDGGLFSSADGGRSWSIRNRDLGLVQFYAGLAAHPTDRQWVLAGTQDNGTLLRRSASDVWRAVFGGDGGWNAVHPTRPWVTFVQFQGAGNLFRSTDGGTTFTAAASGIAEGERSAFQAPIVFDPGDPDRLLYATQRIWESTDLGASWQAISGDLTAGPPAAVRALAIAPSDASRVYALTNDGRLQVSRDGGRSFVLAREGIPGWPRIQRQVAVDPLDADVVFVAETAFGSDRVLRSGDGGTTWTAVGDGLPDLPVATVAVHRAGDVRLVLAGTDRGVYLSRDGAGWVPYGRQLPTAPVNDLHVDLPHRRVLAATLGRGLWEARLPTVADLAGGGGGGGGGGDSCALPPGDGSFCRDCAPCAAGEGDCDRDSDCAAGLVCVQDVGADFDFGPGIDVCTTGSSCPLPPGHGHFCRDCAPCAAGEGDCDRDADCADGLVCGANLGADFGYGPGIDVCTALGR